MDKTAGFERCRVCKYGSVSVLRKRIMQMLSQLLLTSFLRNPLIDVWEVYFLQIASLIASQPFVVEMLLAIKNK
jgi:hypothetical protein